MNTEPHGISNSPEPRGRPWTADAAAVLEQLHLLEEFMAAERGPSAFYVSPATAATAARFANVDAAELAPLFGLPVYVIESPNERRMEATLSAFKGQKVLFEDDAGDFILISPRAARPATRPFNFYA